VQFIIGIDWVTLIVVAPTDQCLTGPLDVPGRDLPQADVADTDYPQWSQSTTAHRSPHHCHFLEWMFSS
jgi:hypothetical protein